MTAVIFEIRLISLRLKSFKKTARICAEMRGTLRPLGKRRKESARGGGPLRAERLGRSESINHLRRFSAPNRAVSERRAPARPVPARHVAAVYHRRCLESPDVGAAVPAASSGTVSVPISHVRIIFLFFILHSSFFILVDQGRLGATGHDQPGLRPYPWPRFLFHFAFLIFNFQKYDISRI